MSLACTLVSPDARAAGDEAVLTTEQLADQAYTLQAAGKFAEAIATYLKAYDLSKDALTLLNIATIYDRKLSEPVLASEYYRRYLMAPDAEPDRVKRVTERLTVLKHAEEEQERARNAPPPTTPAPQAPAAPSSAPQENAPALMPAPEPPQTSHGGPMRTAGIVIGAFGVAGVVGSFVLGYAAKVKNDNANQVCNGLACSSQDGVDSARAAGNFATASTAVFVGSLVFVAGGVALYALAPKGAPASRSGGVFLTPQVDRTGAGIALYGAF